MPEPIATAPTEPDAATVALRRRRQRGLWIAAVAVLLVGSSVWSHVRAPADAASWDGRPGVVCERIIGGDTIVVAAPGLAAEPLRLRGVVAPAVAGDGVVQDEPFGPEARQSLAARLIGRPGDPPRQITLKFDGLEKRDAAGRLWAYVYLDSGDCLNVDLVRDGMAYVDRRSKTILQSTLDPLETQARLRRTGLWKDLKPADMPAWRRAWLEKLHSRADK